MSFADDPAFPVQTVFGPDGYPHWGSNGMTKRELFAAAALQGMLATPARDGTYENYAYDAVHFADALIAELAK